MAITISWSSAIVNFNPASEADPIEVYDEEGNLTETIVPPDPEYKKIGTWYKNGVEMGVVHVPCNADQEPLHTEAQILKTLSYETPAE